MKNIFLVLAMMLFALSAYALPIQVLYQDVKLPTQKVIEKFTVTPAATGTQDILADDAGATSAVAASVTTFVAQPDVARNLVLTPGGTTTDIEACVITVTGTDSGSNAITEDFTFEANATTALYGEKAFLTVTSVSFPADCESGGFAATWSIGYGHKIGLPRCMDNADILFILKGSVRETITNNAYFDPSVRSKNTFTPVNAMDGVNVFQVFFVQNYRCF